MGHKCDTCGEEFLTPTDLQRHKSRKKPCDSGDFPCSDCGHKYASKKSLSIHLRLGRCKGKNTATENVELTQELESLRTQLGQQENSVSAADGDNDSTNHHSVRTNESHAIEPTNLVAISNASEPSQPAQSLVIIDKPDVFEFGDKKIRKTSDTPQRVSVYDFIAAVTDDANPRTTFQRVQNAFSEIVQCYTYKFRGRGNHTSPATDAKGTVMIMNLLPGLKAAQFRNHSACADRMVRCLGGDETLIEEIRRNDVVQQTATETISMRLFNDAVRYDDPSLMIVESATNVKEFRSPQFYMRQVFGKWSNVHPVGRPQDVLSADELAEFAVIKIGSMGVNTNRQMTHAKQFDRSTLLDSCLTSSFTHVETKAKDYWRDHGKLYEGLHEDKTVRDTELLLIKDQPDYKQQLAVVQHLCERFPYITDQPPDDTPLELRLAQEKSRQLEAEARKEEAAARKAEAHARTAEAKLELFRLQH